MSSQHETQEKRAGLFAKTPWGVVTYRARAKAAQRRRAREEFCRIYWWPVFALISRRGFAFADAQDLTQDFLLHFLGSGALSRAHPAKGRLRDFIGAALHHYLINCSARARAQKRGGDLVAVGLGALANVAAPEIGHDGSSPCSCDDEWAAGLIERVLGHLEERYRGERRRLFDALQPYLMSDGETPPPYRKIAGRLRRTPATLRSEVKRMRTQFRAAIRRELRGETSGQIAELREILRQR